MRFLNGAFNKEKRFLTQMVTIFFSRGGAKKRSFHYLAVTDPRSSDESVINVFLRKLIDCSTALLLFMSLATAASMAYAASPVVIDVGSGTLRAGLASENSSSVALRRQSFAEYGIVTD